MAKKASVDKSIPRRCNKQILRSNIAGKKPRTYFCRAIFIPLLDSLLRQLHDRFQGLSARALLGLALIPANLHKLDADAEDKIIVCYSDDFPSKNSVSQEFQLWKRLW